MNGRLLPTNRRRLGDCRRLLAWVWLGILALGVGHNQAAPPARMPWTTSALHGSPEPPPRARVERVFPQLAFNQLTDFAYEPTSHRWFVTEEAGRFVSFPDQPEVARPNLVADLHTLAPKLSQLLAFAFHPGFATNRLVFLHLSETQESGVVARLLRIRLTDTSPPQFDAQSVTELLRWPAGGHDGCCLKFGPDGMLYISIGDGGSPEPPDPRRTGQDISDLLSSILRLDVDHAEGSRAYRIPADNPFVNVPGARGEVWAFGFRNPWRMGFGPDGTLWVGDVGWELWECIHRVTAGYNAGWSLVEGPNPAVRADVKVGPTPVRNPAAAHPHSEAASITGGLVSQATSLPEWRGQLVYGDWETGKIWALRDTPGAQPQELVDTPLRVVSFAEGPNHDVFLADYQNRGGLYRLLPNQASGPAQKFPQRLSETGIFSDVKTQRPAPGVTAYQINQPMWADGATSEQWVAVPDQGTVKAVWNDDANERKWIFPKDSVLVKTISLPVDDGRGQPLDSRIETQLLHFNGEAWAAYSYQWNAAQTDADLVPAPGTNVTFVALNPALPGGRHELAWRFAARAECLRCHNPWSGNTLGLSFDQLLTPSRETTNSTELDRLRGLGLLTLPGKYSTNHLVALGNPAAPLETRARSWLHVNCAPCHRWGAGGSVASYFNFDGKLEDLRLLNQAPSRGTFGLEDARVITPGRPDRSVLWFRINTEGQGHMPHIGSRTVDDAGSRVLARWIESLDPSATPATSPTGGTTTALAALRAIQKVPTRTAAFVASYRNSTNAFARDLSERFLPTSERRQTLGLAFDPRRVLGLTGDVERGRKLFHNDSGPQCARCHLCDGAGRNFGPDLTLISQRYDRAAVLQQILEPSRSIAPEYVLRLIETRDGRSLAGFTSPSAGPLVELRTETGETIRLQPADIASETRSPISAMPEGLLSAMSPEEAADLLAYLMQAR